MSPTILREGAFRLFFFSREAEAIVRRHLPEIRDAWSRHFGR